MDKEPKIARSDDAPEDGLREQENATPRSANDATKRSFLEKFGSYIGLVTGVLSLLTVIFGWFFWLDRRVQDLVAEKIEPYQKMEHAIAKVDNAEYDDAIPLLRDAFEQFKTERDRGSVPARLVDSFLNAIVETRDPIKYEHDFKIVRTRKGVRTH